MNGKAFTLVELLLYLFFLTILTLGIFTFFVTNQKRIEKHAVFCENNIRDTLVLDLLKRDLICACSQRSDWNSSDMIFKKEMLDEQGNKYPVWVGWKVVDCGIWRIEGHYDIRIRQWSQKNINFFGCSITHLALEIKPDDAQRDVEFVVIKYAQKMPEQKKVIEELIRLRNRKFM